MALNSLLDLELAVPDPDALSEFWLRRGMHATGSGTLGTEARPSQLRLKEGAYRHVSELRLGCDSAADLDALTERLDGIGISWTRTDVSVRCADPILDHDVVVEIGEAAPIGPAPERQWNGPGQRNRTNRRSSAITRERPPAPQRVGHVVFGSPDVAASRDFYLQIGMLRSDSLTDGIGHFLRCSPDHHNVLIMPCAVPCMNHYALEMDDVDAIGRAGTEILNELPESSVYGLGRHIIGSNLFWYLLDPAGGMFELFSDMDQITDDAHWDAHVRRDDWDPFTIAGWEPGPGKPDFFMPSDIEVIAKAREAAGR